MRRFKSYDLNKIDYKIMAVSFIFSFYFSLKKTTLGGNFPLELRAHLYIFRISEARGMGKHTGLNLIQTSNFVATHICTMYNVKSLYLFTYK